MRIAVLFILMLPGFFCLAQNCVLEGHVRDSLQNQPLIGATIQVAGQGSTTNVNGFYTLELTAGTHLVEASYIGYQTIRKEIALEPGEQKTLDFILKESTTVLETATITGSKYQKSVARSPVSINVIKASLADNTNTVRVTSLLEKIPGVQIVDNQANIRGGSGFSYGAGSRVLLLIDDIPALQGDAGRPSWGDIPVENISQIEVIKGASSTLYGSAAMNGVINVRTGYATSTPVTKINTSYTHYMDPADPAKKWWDSAPRRVAAGIVHKQKFGKLDLVANGFVEDLESFQEGAFSEKYRLSANLKYRLSDKINFGVNTLYNWAKSADSFIWKNAGSGAYQGLAGSITASNSTRFFIDPQISIVDNKNNRHKILSRIYYINNDNNDNRSNSSLSNYLEYQYISKLPGLGVDLTTGVSALLIDSDSELFSNVELKSNNYAAFLQGDKSFNDRLTITLGLRYEYFYQKSPEFIAGDTIPNGETTEAKLIARAGLNYKAAEGTYFRASWGQGYRVPTLVERFIETQISSFYIFPNVKLESESGWSAEVGVKQGLRLGGWEGFVDLAGFWSRYSNMTEFSFFENEDQRFGFRSENVGAIDIKGFEVNLIGRSTIGRTELNILSGYTFINPRYEEFTEEIQSGITAPVGSNEKENFLKYRSRHNFKLDVEAFYAKFGLGLSTIYASEVLTMDALLANLAQIELYREANPGGYLKTDLRTSYRFKAFKLSLVAENIFNEEYTIRPGLLEAPRNISVRLDVEL